MNDHSRQDDALGGMVPVLLHTTIAVRKGVRRGYGIAAEKVGHMLVVDSVRHHRCSSIGFGYPAGEIHRQDYLDLREKNRRGRPGFA